MKRLLIIALCAMAACKNAPEDAKGKLPTSLVNNPHTASSPSGVDTVSAALKPTMDFKDTVYDFGTIHQSEKVTHEFSFVNGGKTPLIITNASGSCGCTVPEYPHDPLAPGKSAVIKVTFNSAGKSGHQEKSVSIHTNTAKGINMIYIKGEVIAPKDGGGLPTE